MFVLYISLYILEFQNKLKNRFFFFPYFDGTYNMYIFKALSLNLTMVFYVIGTLCAGAMDICQSFVRCEIK